MSTDTARRDRSAGGSRPRRCLDRRATAGACCSAWLVVLVAAIALFKSAGSDFSNSLTLPGTPVTGRGERAAARLPSAGRRPGPDRVRHLARVDHRPGGESADRVRARSAWRSCRTSSRCVSPYSAGGRIRSPPITRVAFATVTFDEQARSLPGRRDRPGDLDRRGRAHRVAAGGARRPGDRARREAVARLSDRDRAARRDHHPADHLRVVHRDGPADHHRAARARGRDQPRRPGIPHHPDPRLRHRSWPR